VARQEEGEKMSVDEYMKLPYHFCYQREYKEKDGDFDGYSVMVLELQGCFSQGETLQEAEEMILDVMRMWLEVSLEQGHTIPLPAKYKEIIAWHKFRDKSPSMEIRPLS
jgi:antitoxin HicB